MTDEELVAALAGGDDSAVAHLLYRHQDRLLGMAHRVPGDFRGDVVQDVFLALHSACLSGTRISNFRAWSNQVLRNKEAEFWRGKQGRQIKREREGAPLGTDVPDDGGFGLVEARLVIEALLAALSPSHRIVVESSVIAGRSGRESAAASGESEANVYQISKRFRTALKAALEQDRM